MLTAARVVVAFLAITCFVLFSAEGREASLDSTKSFQAKALSDMRSKELKSAQQSNGHLYGNALEKFLPEVANADDSTAMTVLRDSILTCSATQGQGTYSWYSGTSVCTDWDGVYCTAAGRVYAVILASDGGCTGQIDFTALPTALATLYLALNQFSGPLDLTHLPSTLVYLFLNHNQFSGSIDLTQLPPLLNTLYLSSNLLSGTPDLCHIPAKLSLIRFQANRFSGTLDLTCVPPTAGHLSVDVSDNLLSEVLADAAYLPDADYALLGNPFRCPLPAQPLWLRNAMGECQAIGICFGGTITDSTGTLVDIPGDVNYMNNMDCSTILQAPEGIVVTATFTEFCLAQHSDDYLYVYDGNTTDDHLLTSTTGCKTLPPSFQSSGNSLLIRLVTQDTITDRGFSMDWSFSHAICEEAELTGSSGTIVDGSGEADYSPNMNCQTVIRAPAGTMITLSFTEFCTQQGTDFVRIFDGEGVSEATALPPLSGCVSIPSKLRSSGSVMTIQFTTGSSVTQSQRGFTITWSVAYGICGALDTITSPYGTIMDGSGFSNYDANIDCGTAIHAPVGYTIALAFPAFCLQQGWDYLYVHDGNTANGDSLATYSGCQTFPPTVRSSGLDMFIRFTSSQRMTANGFTLMWNFVPNPVNCVGEWVTLGACSATCGTGAQKSIFYITTAAAFGGAPCAVRSSTTKTTPCNTDSCAAKAGMAAQSVSELPSRGCSLPSPLPRGYDGSAGKCGGVVEASACQGIVCAEGFSGVVTLTCPSARAGNFILSGCSVNKCTLPSELPPAYQLSPTSQCGGGGGENGQLLSATEAALCKVSCSPVAVRPGPVKLSCLADGAEFILTGCGDIEDLVRANSIPTRA